MKKKLIFIILFSLALAGCKNKFDAELNTNNTKQYKLINECTVEKSAKDIKQVFFTDTCVYEIVEEESINTLYATDYCTKNSKKLYTLEQNERITSFDVNEENNMIAIVKESNTQTQLELINIEGKINNSFQINAGDIDLIKCISNEAYVLVSKEKVYRYNGNGELIHTIVNDDEMNRNLIVNENDDLVTYVNRGKGEVLRVYDGGTLELKIKEELLSSKLWLRGYKKPVYYDSGHLMEYMIGKEDATILDLSTYNIDYTQIIGINNQEDILVVACDTEDKYEIYLFSTSGEFKQNGVITDTRKELSFLSINNFQSAVNKFNQTNQEYVIKGNITKREQYEARVIAERPDVLEIFGEEQLHDYEKTGYLFDLSKYIASSENIGLEDFHECVINNLLKEEEIYTVPKKMGLLTLIGPKKELMEYNNWLVDDFFNFLNKYPNAFSYNDRTVEEVKTNILRILLYGIIESEDSLDYDELAEYIKKIKELPISIPDEDNYLRIQEGEVVIIKTDEISTPDALSKLKSKTGVDLAIIGFPGSKEGAARSIICFDNMLSIYADSKNPEGAWEFLESYIMQASNMYGTFIPTNKKGFEDALQIGTDRERETIDNVTYVPVTPDDICEIRTAYDNVKNYYGIQKEIVDIVTEEVYYFFSGQKDIADVMDVIKSRVNILIRESK